MRRLVMKKTSKERQRTYGLEQILARTFVRKDKLKNLDLKKKLL